MIDGLMAHLWQSTFFAVAAALLTLAFRGNRAQVRYWLWLSASLKFFVPFALLMRLGSLLETWVPAAHRIATPVISYTVEQFNQPLFIDALPTAPLPSHPTSWIPVALVALWLCGFLAIAAVRFRNWLRIRAAVHTSTPTSLAAVMEVRFSTGLLEPGVVGLLRPILLLPAGIAERLTPSELKAILAHELCHIRRRDNLFAAIHMVVEAIFWFHPLVWWIGARLVAERERACDEEVLNQGNQPDVYADAILNVCKLYFESPLACVSGVSGASIRRRIEAIMSNRQQQGLNRAKKFLLASVGAVALAGPVVIGLVFGVGNVPAISAQLTAPAAAIPPLSPQEAQVRATTPQEAAAKSQPAARLEFDAASVRLVNSSGGGGRGGPLGGIPLGFSPGRVTGREVTTRGIILAAYHLTPYQLSGGPAWLDSETYDVEATAADSSATENQLRQMLRTLLARRFKLVVSHQTRETPVYALVVAKNGPKLHEVKDGDATPRTGKEMIALGVLPPPRQGEKLAGQMFNRMNMEEFAAELSIYPELDRPVLDRTGLAGVYLVGLRWYADGNIATAMQEWLGLKLEPQKAPMDATVVDRIERPSEN